MSLGFQSPLLLWGLLAAALPLLVHLLFRRRPRPTAFPAIDFVLRARRRVERRLRLRKLLLFAARTLLLAAAALAMARPSAEQPGAPAAAAASGPQATVVVLDASASMQYGLGGEPLFARARREALAALTGLSGEDPASALVCDGRPPVAAAPGFDRAVARRVLDDASAGQGHADLTACLAAAARALGEARDQEAMGKRIVVVTDLTAAAWRLEAPPPHVAGPGGLSRPLVQVVDAARGAELPNTAVTDLAAEPDPAVGPRGYRLTVTVASTGAAPLHDLPLTLRVGGEARPALRAFLDVPAGASARKTLSWSFQGGGPTSLTASVPGDALGLDDERTLALEVPREIRALLVDGAPSPDKHRDEAYFVESALGSPASPVRPTLIDAEALREADLGRFDVVFLLNVRSVGGRAADLLRFVEAGGGLFLSLGDQVDPDQYGKELGALLPLQLHLVKTAAEGPGEARAAHLGRIDEAHPALSVFTGEAREGLAGARFLRYLLTRPPGKGEAPAVLAAFDDGAPALVEARRGRGRVLLYTSSVDRDWSDWAIRTSFLPAMQRFAAWLAGALEERREAPTVVGTPREVRPGEGRTLRALVAPDGQVLTPAVLEPSAADRLPPGGGPAEGALGPGGGGRDGGAAGGGGPGGGGPGGSRSGGGGPGGGGAEARRDPAPGPARAEGGGAFTFTPRRCGLWQVRVGERGAERIDPALAFAVVPDPRESDTRRLQPGELTAWLGGEAHAKVDGPGGSALPSRGVPLWSWLLAAAVALFLAEGVLLRG